MAHQIVQVKWLHSDGFRRFELEQPSYERLKEAIKCRISSFQSGICYTGEQLVEMAKNDQNLRC